MSEAQAAVCIFEEQRQSERQEVAIDARGFVPNLNNAIDCTILDISDTGARIELRRVDIIPSKFKLFVPETHTLFDCRVVRKFRKYVGLVFENRIELKPS